MLKTENIWCILGGKPILQGVSVGFAPKTITGLIGPSGGGKSTLLKVLSGVLPPDKGSVIKKPSESISLSFQEGALFDSLSVIDNVVFPLTRGKVPVQTVDFESREAVFSKAKNIIERVGLGKALNKLPGQLSGGMRKRLALARALVTYPDILLLDDPTSGLDPVASSVIMKLIVEIHNEFLPTTVIVSQDLRRLIPASHDLVALDSGKVVYAGPTPEFPNLAPDKMKHFVHCRYDWA